MFAGVVASIADYDQHFLVATPLLQVFESHGNCIIECRFTIGLHSGEDHFQLRHFACKWDVVGKAKPDFFVEVDHEHMVLRVAGAGKCQGCCDDISALWHHTSTVVDDQTNRDGDILVAKGFDRLQRSVLVYLEVVFTQPGNQNVLAVLSGGSQDHHVDIDSKRVWVLRAVLQWSGCLRPTKARQSAQDKDNKAPKCGGRQAYSPREMCCRVQSRLALRPRHE